MQGEQVPLLGVIGDRLWCRATKDDLPWTRAEDAERFLKRHPVQGEQWRQRLLRSALCGQASTPDERAGTGKQGIPERGLLFGVDLSLRGRGSGRMAIADRSGVAARCRRNGLYRAC